MKSLRCEQEESLKRAKDSLVENKDLVEKVCSLQERIRHADKLSCELQQHLKMKEESLQVCSECALVYASTPLTHLGSACHTVHMYG